MADGFEAGFEVLTPESDESLDLIVDYLQPALDMACGGSFMQDSADQLLHAREMSNYENDHTYSLRFFAFKSSKIHGGPQQYVVYEITLAHEYPWLEGQYWPPILLDESEHEDYDTEEDNTEGRYIQESYTFTIDDNTFKPRKDVAWRFVKRFEDDEEPFVCGVEGLHTSTIPSVMRLDTELSPLEEDALEKVSEDFLHTFSKEDVAMILDTLGKLGLRGYIHD